MTMERETILLAESNSQDAYLLEAAFQAAHIENPVEVISTERESMEYLLRNGGVGPRELPALVILAMPLPFLNNFRLLRWIRAQPELHALQVFVLAAVEIRDEDIKAHELGSDRYGVKPRDFSGLVELVQRLEKRFLKHGDSRVRHHA